jgi:tRNA (mo5U34)-methyltransferase
MSVLDPDPSSVPPAAASPAAIPAPTDAERAFADLLPIEADPDAARAVLAAVPLWFHTFALNREHGLYAPGVARDHRYRAPVLEDDYGGLAVLDVGTFDGFYAYLAEHRGAVRVLAVDNEQYVHWVRARWGIDLHGGEGLRAIGRLLDTRVEYQRLDAFELATLTERFDRILCFGILHRVENPLGLLRALAGLLAPGGRLLVETYGVAADGRPADGRIEVHPPSEVYRGDDYVYWGFGSGGLIALAAHAGFSRVTIDATPTIDRHPRILGTFERPGG